MRQQGPAEHKGEKYCQLDGFSSETKSKALGRRGKWRWKYFLFKGWEGGQGGERESWQEQEPRSPAQGAVDGETLLDTGMQSEPSGSLAGRRIKEVPGKNLEKKSGQEEKYPEKY